MKRNWTYKEIQSLIAFREERKSVKECARILSRPKHSVRQQLYRMGIVIYPKSNISKKVKHYVLRGKTDSYISFKLNCSKWKIVYWRKKLKLKANQERNKKHRARCFGCNRIAPLVISNGWARLCGWKTENLFKNDLETIAFCPECYNIKNENLIESNWRN